jgi:hypothetical protein
MQISNRALYGAPVNLDIDRFFSIGEGIGKLTIGRRQLDQALRLEQQKQAAADHVFECAVCLSPLPRPANLSGNEASASRRIGRYDLPDDLNVAIGNVTAPICGNDLHGRQDRASKELFKNKVDFSFHNCHTGSHGKRYPDAHQTSSDMALS